MTIKVKICGITREEDALYALESGADCFGMIFYKKSPRYVPVERAKEIMDFLKAKGISAPPAIGVFVNEQIHLVREYMNTLGLFAVQLHGEESPEYCADLHCRIIKAFRVRDAGELRAITNYRVWAFLFDAFHPVLAGGTGKRIDASLLSPYIQEHRIFLAGGLSPENISSVLETISPFGVDVSTGVESLPGIKDPDKVRRFIAAVKGI